MPDDTTVPDDTDDPDDTTDPDASGAPDLAAELLAGSQRALARAITRIENRAAGHRDLVAELHAHAGSARVIGVTGAPGAGKSTLVDRLAATYRERGLTVGVVAVDPASPYTGGAVLGDRIRMASNVGDMGVFFRSMSARGRLGGLSMATNDAVTALDAFGKDVVLIETVGAGQNEVDVVRAADTVAVLVQPGSGDDVQTLKAGILEIGDVFVVNKGDREGAERTLAELEEMVHERDQPTAGLDAGHHGGVAVDTTSETTTDDTTSGTTTDGDRPNDRGDPGDHDDSDGHGSPDDRDDWTPPVLRTVATTGEGVEELIDAFASHASYLAESGEAERRTRRRHAEEIRTLVRADLGALADEELARHGGVETLAERVRRRDADPYTIADEVVEPIATCVASLRTDDDRAANGDGDDR